MKLFHNYTFTWWQLGVFKLSLISLGIIIGSYWADIANDYLWSLATVAVVSTVYIIYLDVKQR